MLDILKISRGEYVERPYLYKEQLLAKGHDAVLVDESYNLLAAVFYIEGKDGAPLTRMLDIQGEVAVNGQAMCCVDLFRTIHPDMVPEKAGQKSLIIYSEDPQSTPLAWMDYHPSGEVVLEINRPNVRLKADKNALVVVCEESPLPTQYPSTRTVELMICVVETGGWHTEYVQIPGDTRDKDIADMAVGTWKELHPDSDAIVLVYNIPPLDGEGE